MIHRMRSFRGPTILDLAVTSTLRFGFVGAAAADEESAVLAYERRQRHLSGTKQACHDLALVPVILVAKACSGGWGPSGVAAWRELGLMVAIKTDGGPVVDTQVGARCVERCFAHGALAGRVAAGACGARFQRRAFVHRLAGFGRCRTSSFGSRDGLCRFACRHGRGRGVCPPPMGHHLDLPAESLASDGGGARRHGGRLERGRRRVGRVAHLHPLRLSVNPARPCASMWVSHASRPAATHRTGFGVAQSRPPHRSLYAHHGRSPF